MRRTPHRPYAVALEHEAQFLRHGGEQERCCAQGGVDLGPLDALLRGQTAEAQAVDGAELPVVRNAEAVVVDICALQTLQLRGVVLVCCLQCVTFVLEFREGEGEGVAVAPEFLLFFIEG